MGGAESKPEEKGDTRVIEYFKGKLVHLPHLFYIIEYYSRCSSPEQITDLLDRLMDSIKKSKQLCTKF